MQHFLIYRFDYLCKHRAKKGHHVPYM